MITLVSLVFLAPNSVVQVGENIALVDSRLRLVLVLVVDLLILFAVLLMVRPSRRSRTQDVQGLSVRSDGAMADIDLMSARERILKAITDVPKVIFAEAKVESISGRADIDLEVIVARDTQKLPDKQREIDRALRQVVEKQLGLEMYDRPRVHLQLESLSPAPPVVVETRSPVVVSEPIKVPAAAVPLVEPTPVVIAPEPTPVIAVAEPVPPVVLVGDVTPDELPVVEAPKVETPSASDDRSVKTDSGLYPEEEPFSEDRRKLP